MPLTKNALIRYRTIDRCLQNPSRKWTLADLILACSDALYELEGKDTYVSKRTVQLDIQLLRSDKLGYSAPIEVYDRKYYRYSDPDYSITDIPLTEVDLDVLTESVMMLRQFKDFSLFSELNGVIQKLEDKIYRESGQQSPIIHLDKNEHLKGLEHLDVLYQSISKRIRLGIDYRSFKARAASRIELSPYILKEFNNRWFVVGRNAATDQVLTLALDRVVAIHPDFKGEYSMIPFPADTYYKDTIGVTVIGQEPDEVRLWINPQNLPYILTKPLHGSQQLLVRNQDGSGEIGITVQHNFELERLLLGFGNGVKVITPRRLRSRMKKILRDALAYYQ